MTDRNLQNHLGNVRVALEELREELEDVISKADKVKELCEKEVETKGIADRLDSYLIGNIDQFIDGEHQSGSVNSELTELDTIKQESKEENEENK